MEHVYDALNITFLPYFWNTAIYVSPSRSVDSSLICSNIMLETQHSIQLYYIYLIFLEHGYMCISVYLANSRIICSNIMIET